MKRNWLLTTLMCLSSILSAHALTVSVDGYGTIPAEGMELTLSEVEEDIMTGEMRMALEGSLLSDKPVYVYIERSNTGLTDEFCCAGSCTGGNREQTELLEFEVKGMANWFAHYTPQPGSSETIRYTFYTEQHTEERTLTVVYDYSTQAIDNVSVDNRNEGVYTLSGQRLQTTETGLPEGLYIINGQKIIKTTH